MSEATVPEPCSFLSARAGLSMAGSAGTCDAVVAVELEAPWTARIAGSRGGGAGFDEALATLADRRPGAKLLAVEPRSRAARRDVLLFEGGGGGFAGFTRRRFAMERDAVPAFLTAWAGAGHGAPDEVLAGPAGAASVPDEPGVRDILVCTHGSRDACCARFGYPIYAALAAREAAGAPIRAWRCSHLGGHRFAPTLLDLPSGRMFGRIREGDLDALVSGGAALAALADRIYRGRVVLPEAAQPVEKELWLRAGSALDGAPVSWTVEEREGGFRVCVDGGRPGLALGARVARDEPAAVALPASCGRDPEAETPWRLLPD